MRKFWLVFAHEYWRQVNQKRFLLALLSLPALGLLLVIVAGMSLLFMEDYRPIGYVDYSGLLSNPVDINPEDMTLVRHVQVIRFTDEDKARQALEVDRIQLYFVLDKDYLANGRIRLMAKIPPSEVAISRFSKFLQANLVSQYSDLVKKRLLSQMRLEISTPDQSLRTSDRQWIQFVFPFLSGAMLIIAISTSGGYLLQALTDEKENRTIEIMVTSVSPTELMMGKILGNVCVGLTQLLVWMTYPLWAGVTALFLIPSLKASNFIGLSFWLSLILMLLIFILVSAILAMIGTVMVDHHSAQLVSSLLLLVIMSPLYALNVIVTNPNWWLAVGLSLFPLTAPILLPLRVAFTTVPLWQIVLSLGFSVLATIGALLVAGRVFRLGMLRYGKPLKLCELFKARVT